MKILLGAKRRIDEAGMRVSGELLQGTSSPWRHKISSAAFVSLYQLSTTTAIATTSILFSMEWPGSSLVNAARFKTFHSHAPRKRRKNSRRHCVCVCSSASR